MGVRQTYRQTDVDTSKIAIHDSFTVVDPRGRWGLLLPLFLASWCQLLCNNVALHTIFDAMLHSKIVHRSIILRAGVHSKQHEKARANGSCIHFL